MHEKKQVVVGSIMRDINNILYFKVRSKEKEEVPVIKDRVIRKLKKHYNVTIERGWHDKKGQG